ncbi:hypothetical protein [Advenella kashmirensis]|uniref:hypothetical protein n=1 Tax=Advenella kashmirensis TaxID=310575 RepID=UPI000425F1B2|nr:hypothetical protein [Advenella kashmirensis]
MKLLSTTAIFLSLILLSGCIIHDHGRGGRWNDRDGYGYRDRHHYSDYGHYGRGRHRW